MRCWKGAENGLSCQYGKLKSSESDSPMKIRWPILSDSKFSSGPAFLSILKFAYFWHFYIGKKKSLTLGSDFMCHIKLRVSEIQLVHILKIFQNFLLYCIFSYENSAIYEHFWFFRAQISIDWEWKNSKVFIGGAAFIWKLVFCKLSYT